MTRSGMTAQVLVPGASGGASRVRHALLRRIHQRYATVTEPARPGGVEFPFTRVAEPAVVLEDIVREENRRYERRGDGSDDRDTEPLHMPYWAEIWDSAFGVAQALCNLNRHEAGGALSDRPRPRAALVRPICDRGGSVHYSPENETNLTTERHSLRGVSVLDLGCGMGLAGATAAALGAEVLLADVESPALLFARLNTLPWRDRCRVRRLDWRADRLGKTFDLIVGADILYERNQWDFVEPFWRAHLSPGGAVLLAEPGRQTGDRFPAWITARPWALDESAERLPSRAKPIRIFRLTRA